MIVDIVVILIIVLCMAHFYLRSSTLGSFAAIMSAIFASLISFGFFEPLANMTISAGFIIQYAHSICFFVLFAVSFAILYALSDLLVGSNIAFHDLVKKITAAVSGIIVGLILSGILIVVVAMTPIGSKWPYPRYASGRAIVPGNPEKLITKADGIVTGLFTWISKGSLSGKNSFGVFRADFIDQLFANRRKVKEGVCTVAAKDAIAIPKNGARIIEGEDGTSQTVIRVYIKTKEITNGGARDKKNILSFTLSQLRLICKDKASSNDMKGSAVALFPKQYRINSGSFEQADLDAIVRAEGGQFVKRSGYGQVIWIDLIFDIPGNKKPVILEFKQNAVAQVPDIIKSTPESEEQLNSDGTQDSESQRDQV